MTERRVGEQGSRLRGREGVAGWAAPLKRRGAASKRAASLRRG